MLSENDLYIKSLACLEQKTSNNNKIFSNESLCWILSYSTEVKFNTIFISIGNFSKHSPLNVFKALQKICSSLILCATFLNTQKFWLFSQITSQWLKDARHFVSLGVLLRGTCLILKLKKIFGSKLTFSAYTKFTKAAPETS